MRQHNAAFFYAQGKDVPKKCSFKVRFACIIPSMTV